MEIGKNWGKIDPAQLETFERLGMREQDAVIMALGGIHRWQLDGKEPKPMRVKIKPDNPFDLKAFAGVMHELQIGIADSLVRTEDDVVTFQPRPYSKTFMPANDMDKLNALIETIEEQLAGLPPELRDYFRSQTQK